MTYRLYPFPSSIETSSEPLLATFPAEIADLSQTVSTPIALGERLFSRFDFRPYLEARAIDIAQPDVCTFRAVGLCAHDVAGRTLWRHQRTTPHSIVDGDV